MEKSSRTGKKENVEWRDIFKEIFKKLIILIKSPIVTAVIGLIIGFLISDNMTNFQYHYPYRNLLGKQISSYSYVDFEEIYTKFPANVTINDQQLTVQNHWKGLVHTTTKIISEDKNIEIRCRVDKTNESCENYKIKGDDSVTLSIEIDTGEIERKIYKGIYIQTYQKQRENNFIEKELILDIGEFRPRENTIIEEKGNKDYFNPPDNSTKTEVP